MSVNRVTLLFQFQYGAIKTQTSSTRPTAMITFQFQYGAIKTDDRQNESRPDSISIPIWCD